MVLPPGSQSARSPGSQSARSPKRTMTKLAITQDDSKILGNLVKRLEKSGQSSVFRTNLYKTQNSAWTPIVHRPSNQQIFMERNELVSHWYDVWTDNQRKYFLDTILRGCKRSQLLFMQNWFQERVPLERLDFTTVLPRFLSIYIFSYLDPRSLCRSSQVSWHWKFLAEQDDIWLPKCVKLGWFLPYQPTQREFGAWKTHYIACTFTLHKEITSQEEIELFFQMEEEKVLTKRKNMLLRSNKLTQDQRDLMLTSRPPWMDTDPKPRDLELASRSLLLELNPNTPRAHKTDNLFHDKFGINKARLSAEKGGTRSLQTAFVQEYTDYGLTSARRRHGRRTLHSDEDFDLGAKTSKSMTLSQSMTLQNLEEKRLQELVNQPWQPPAKRITDRRDNNLSGGLNYPLPWKYCDRPVGPNAYLTQVNPRVVFISSRVPAADILTDAVIFGVIPILYEYEGSTLETLTSRLDTILAGREARSIAVFGHQMKPGEMRLVYGHTLDLESLPETEIMEFFIQVTERTLAANKGGHVDLFAPFGSCESGMEVLYQLQLLTGMNFNAPTGVLGNYNHLDSEWLRPNEDGPIPPPALYFVPSKMAVWVNCADTVTEACAVTKKAMEAYFDGKHRDLVSQITGQLVFDAMGDVDVQALYDVMPVVVDGLVNLVKSKPSKPLETLTKFLHEQAGHFRLNLEEQPTSMEESPNMSNQRSDRAGGDYADDFETDAVIEEGVEDEGAAPTDETDEKRDKPKDVTSRTTKPRPMSMSASSDALRSMSASSDALRSLSPRKLIMSMDTMTKRMTSAELAGYPDKRRAVAREMLATETEYRRTLDALVSVFMMPLRSAVESNRPIVSAASIQTMFSIPLQILELSRIVEADLQNKLTEWSPQQCLGDVFIKFCSRLKVYTNYCNNYSVILSCIDRCVEQYPGFRAFLKRHNRQPNTKMLTLQELLLQPTRRIGEYVRLLAWFELHTPRDHVDRLDLSHALSLIGDVNEFILECKQRLEQDKELIRVQKIILQCPSLLEGNRFLIRQEDVARLRAPETSVDPDLRVYQQMENLGLFLFNDALVVTRRTSKHLPYERNVEHTYRFLCSLSLNKLKITDIPDTKYVESAFRLATASKRFYCQSRSGQDKMSWISRLESAIIAAVENN